MNRRMDAWMDERRGLTRRTVGFMEVDERTGKWAEGCVDEWTMDTNGQRNAEVSGQMNDWVGGWMGKQKDNWLHDKINNQMARSLSVPGL